MTLRSDRSIRHMLDRMKVALFLALALLGFGFSAPSSAAIARAYQVVYFDANNNIIGETLDDCQNNASYAGQTTPTNANRIRIEFGCGNTLISCGSPVWTGTYWADTCSPQGVDYGKSVTYFHSATGLPQSAYCDAGLTGAFAGTTGCDLPAPSQVSNIGTFYDGFPPQ